MLIRFGDFVLDRAARQLTRHGSVLSLSPKALQLLQILIEQRPRVVAKEELIDRLWPDVTVEEANVRNLIAEIRQALDDDDREPKYIRTAHRLGYAFIGPAGQPARRSFMRLHDTNATYPLSDGANIVGRVPECAIHLDSGSVSRRHASLTVSPGGAVLEDLGSKNGTWLNGNKVQAPVELHDGDRVRFGGVQLIFRATLIDDSTGSFVLDEGDGGLGD